MAYALLGAVVGSPAIEVAVTPVEDGTSATGTYHLGSSDGEHQREGQETGWDANLANGLDTDWRQMYVVINEGGGYDGVNATVSSTLDSYSGLSYGTINDVQLVATAHAEGLVASWRSIAVFFYRWDTVQEMVTVPDGSAPMADTTQPGITSLTQVLRVPATDTVYTKVVISGHFRFQATSQAAGDMADMTVQVLVGVNDPTWTQPDINLLPDALQLDTSHLDLTDANMSPSGWDTNPLIADRFYESAQYGAAFVVVHGGDSDIYIAWDSCRGQWAMTIVFNLGQEWKALGSTDPNNPLGDFNTATFSSIGYGWIVATQVA